MCKVSKPVDGYVLDHKLRTTNHQNKSKSISSH